MFPWRASTVDIALVFIDSEPEQGDAFFARGEPSSVSSVSTQSFLSILQYLRTVGLYKPVEEPCYLSRCFGFHPTCLTYWDVTGLDFGKRVDSSAGWSSGYQMFFPGIPRQGIMNFGGRKDTNNTNSDCTKGALAVDAGYQPAKGQHVMAGVDSFGAVP